MCEGLGVIPCSHFGCGLFFPVLHDDRFLIYLFLPGLGVGGGGGGCLIKSVLFLFIFSYRLVDMPCL